MKTNIESIIGTKIYYVSIDIRKGSFMIKHGTVSGISENRFGAAYSLSEGGKIAIQRAYKSLIEIRKDPHFSEAILESYEKTLTEPEEIKIPSEGKKD